MAKKCMASGGTPKPYDAQGSNVEKGAEERKHGGKVKRAKGGGVHHHGMVEHKHKGKVEHVHKSRKHGGKIEGEKAKERMDRPRRASGGRTGSDKSPLSSAHHASPVVDHRTDDM